MAGTSSPHIFEHPVSSYAQKVKIALREKNIVFTSEVPADISSSSPGPLHESNPRVEVPVLRHNGNVVFDSSVIMEYIEDVWPDPPLLPTDPGARATARMIEEVCDTQYEAVNWVSPSRAPVRWLRLPPSDTGVTSTQRSRRRDSEPIPLTAFLFCRALGRSASLAERRAI